jgi:hypothetical protein
MDTIKEGRGVPSPPQPPDWRTALDERMRTHVAYCQNYVADWDHGPPGHYDLVTIDALAKLLDGQPLTRPRRGVRVGGNG